MKLIYKWSLLRRLLKYTSPFFKPFDYFFKIKYASRKSSFEPIFIVGIPRSGTTLLYQLLTNAFDVTYISNFVKLGRENLFLAFWMNSLIFGNKPHNSFKSKYGITNKLIAPNEDTLFWIELKEKYYLSINADDIDSNIKKTIFQKFSAISNKFQKPILLKNFNVNIHLPLIKILFPNAKFIYLKRDYIYTAQSIYQGILDGKGELFQDWIMNKPKGFEKILDFENPKKIVHYIHLLTKQIEKELLLFPSENIFKLNYEDLGNELETILDNIQMIGNINKRVNPQMPKIQVRNRIKIDKEVFDDMQQEIDKLDWEFDERT